MYRAAVMAILMAVSALLVSCQEENDAPNFVLILADDLGYGSLGCYGNDSIATPNLDRLAREGLLLRNFYANGAVCTPTRAALLTGRYQQRSGLEGVIYARGPTRQVGLDLSEKTIAEQLQERGYTTAIFGKWHLGYDPQFNPVNQGFSEFVGYVSGNVDYQTHVDGAGVYDWWNGKDTAVQKGYVTELITDAAQQFISQHRSDPFLMYVAHESPHVPFQGPSDPGYRQVDSSFSYLGPVEDRGRALREMIESLDESVGAILTSLQRNKLEEKTLVIFISDNGGERWADNGQLRGHKTMLSEGGIRVPAIFYWPGRIHPSTTRQVALTMDIMPTLLRLAGSSQQDLLTMDGLSLASLVLDNQDLPERTVFWKYRDWQAARSDRWKLLVHENDTSLFDLSTDPGETTDLRPLRTAVADRLIDELREWTFEMEQTPQKTR